jgi:hypothetical protein
MKLLPHYRLLSSYHHFVGYCLVGRGRVDHARIFGNCLGRGLFHRIGGAVSYRQPFTEIFKLIGYPRSVAMKGLFGLCMTHLALRQITLINMVDVHLPCRESKSVSDLAETAIDCGTGH